MPYIPVTSVSNVVAAGIDGWVDDSANVWTFASTGPDTFTVAGDRTAAFSKGTRIKMTNSTLKYFLVVSSSFGAGVTTVTITGGTDYTLANAAISGNYYSYAANPQGYPTWFNYTPTYTGFSVNPALSGGEISFAVVGKMCTVYHRPVTNGTSNATGFTVSLPINCVGAGGQPAAASVTDNGTNETTPGRVEAFNPSAGVATIHHTFLSGSTWTTSGAKNALFVLIYEI